MTIDTTEPIAPPRARRPARSRKPPAARWASRQRLRIPQRVTKRREPVPHADAALHELVSEGDIFRVGRRLFFVAPISHVALEALIVAAGSTEDLEPEADMGPEEIAEGDGECDAEEDDPPEQDDHGGGNVEDEGEPDPADHEPSLVAPTGSGIIPGAPFGC